MNAIDLLKREHRIVETLFERLKGPAAAANGQKGAIAAKIFVELEIHTRIEEEIFYPAVKHTDDVGSELATEAIEAHSEVKHLIDQLRQMSVRDDAYDEKLSSLRDIVEEHVELEEGEMFPAAEQSLGGERLDELGQLLAEQRRSIESSARDTDRSPRTAIGSRRDGGRRTEHDAIRTSAERGKSAAHVHKSGTGEM